MLTSCWLVTHAYDVVRHKCSTWQKSVIILSWVLWIFPQNILFELLARFVSLKLTIFQTFNIAVDHIDCFGHYYVEYTRSSVPNRLQYNLMWNTFPTVDSHLGNFTFLHFSVSLNISLLTNIHPSLPVFKPVSHKKLGWQCSLILLCLICNCGYSNLDATTETFVITFSLQLKFLSNYGTS